MLQAVNTPLEGTLTDYNTSKREGWISATNLPQEKIYFGSNCNIDFSKDTSVGDKVQFFIGPAATAATKVLNQSVEVICTATLDQRDQLLFFAKQNIERLKFNLLSIFLA